MNDKAQVENQGMKVVINGGSITMESATVGVQCFFSEEVIKQKPTHILIIELDENEMGDKDEFNKARAGRRYVVPVTKVVEFIQFHSPGKHRFSFLAFGCGAKEMEGFLKRNNSGHSIAYTYGIYWKEEEEKEAEGKVLKSPDCLNLMAYCIAEVEVPEGLFAKKPKSWFGQALWWWSNVFFVTKPVDECDYRKRVIFSLTVQPFIVLVEGVILGILSTIASALLILKRVTVFYFGWRPKSLFTGFKEVWNWIWTFDVDWSNADWDAKRFPFKGSRCVWKYEYDLPGPRSRPIKKMWISPFGATVVGLLIWFGTPIVWKLLVSVSLGGLMCFAFYVGLVVTLFGFFELLKRFKWVEKLGRLIDDCLDKYLSKKGMEEKQQQEKVDPYTLWLRKNLSLEKAPKSVDLKHLPVPFKPSVVNTVRIKFWEAKRAVCRPFAK